MAHILVVDDEPAVLMLFARVLTKAGHRASVAASLTEAVSAYDREPCDLLVTDKNLPGETGFDVIRKLRERNPALPAILMTAYPEPMLGKVPPIHGYLAKPMEVPQILDAINRVLSFAAERPKAKEEEAASDKPEQR